MDNVVHTWEDVELTDAELENIYGGGFPMTLTGNVLGYPVTVSGIVATGLSIDTTAGTGALTTDACTANITLAGTPSAIAHVPSVSSVPSSPSINAPSTSVSSYLSATGHTTFPITQVFGR